MRTMFRIAGGFVSASVLGFSGFACALDWDSFAIPASAGQGKSWILKWSHSDQFNYQGKIGTNFANKWNDTYVNGWTGPGRSEWSKAHSDVVNGELVLRASSKDANTVNMGIISSKNPISYPIYTEARIKVANLELSSNFWFISQDQTREMDVLEIYGGSNVGNTAKNAKSNFHVFFRDNTGDIDKDFADSRSHTTSNDNGVWRNAYHRFGAHWKSPTEVDFYIDGQKLTNNASWSNRDMRVSSGERLDKAQYNMSKAMHIILDLEEHTWRYNAGYTDTASALDNPNRNRVYVDWIRTYGAQ